MAAFSTEAIMMGEMFFMITEMNFGRPWIMTPQCVRGLTELHEAGLITKKQIEGTIAGRPGVSYRKVRTAPGWSTFKRPTRAELEEQSFHFTTD